MSVINIQHAEAEWFKGAGYYVITQYNEFIGPYDRKEDAIAAEKYRTEELDP